MRPAHWKLWPRQYRRVAAFADSTSSPDVYAYASAVIAPALLALDTAGLPEHDRLRLERHAADRAIAELPRQEFVPLEQEPTAAPDFERLVEHRSRFHAMRLTPTQRQVADTMLRLGTDESRVLADELGISPTTVRRHQQAIRLAASTAA